MKAPAEDREAERHRVPRAPVTGAEPAADAKAAESRAEGQSVGAGARPLSPAGAQRLQRVVGNRAVSGLIAQRRTGSGRPTKSGRASSPTAQRTGAGAGPTKGGAASGGPTSTAVGPASGGGLSVGGGTAGQPSVVDLTGADLSTAAQRSEVAPVTQQPEAGWGVQRLAEGGGGAAVRVPGPEADPKFAALTADVRAKQKRLAAHPPATSEAAKAQGAAKPPQDDKEAQGKAANAEKMNAAKPGTFDKAAFVKAVNDAIAAQAPNNLEEADNFGGSGKAAAVKGQVQGQVSEGKQASASAIETTTKAPPDTSAAKEKPVTPLVADQPPAVPQTPDPAKAVPDPAPASATDFSAGPAQVDQQMAEAQVTEEQLAKSNEPEFTGALAEKKAGEQHAATAPGQIRAAEAQTLAGAKAQAGAAGAATMTALATDRKQSGAAVGSGKEEAKSADEVKRAQVTAKLQKVFDATKKDVEDILTGLDKKVDDQFTAGEKAARDAFTADHTRRMDAYKEQRYSGLTGKARWVKDKFAGLPAEANQIFVVARKGYVDRMQQVISAVADTIGAELNRAKQRIATGRDQLKAEVASLSPELQTIGKQAAGEFSAKFDELTESVDAKGNELVQTLATKYNDALKSVDEEIEAEKEKNKGLIAKAVDAVGGVIRTILQLKDMLLGVLAKAASAVMAIIKDPIGFLGNLVSAVGAGLQAFLANIAEHLKKGLIGWLLGALTSAGLELPAKFDLRGIIMMIGSLLGLTWGAIKGMIVAKGVPAPAVEAVEKSAPIAQKLQSEGIGGIWEDIKEKVGDLKANLLSKISEYLIPTVLMAGITWIISLLNPASAFIKAAKMIIDIITFIVTRGAQIIEFVNSVLDAVIAIAGGGAGGVPALIEKALAKSVPVLIGALAAILGIGGIADKVKKFFQSLANPVRKAVGWIADKLAGFGKRLWAKLKGKFGRRGQEKKPGELSPKQQEKVAQQAADEAFTAASRVPIGQISGALDAVHAKWQPKGLKSLEMIPLGNHQFTVEAQVNPKRKARQQGSADLDEMPEPLAMGQVTATSFASSTTAASGSFVADASSEISGVMMSGAKQAQLELSDSQQGAHAEEQVVNTFDRAWTQRADTLSRSVSKKSGRKAHLFENVRMIIDVSKSSCVNCASYIVRFARKLRDKTYGVQAKMRFASLYKGKQSVPASNMNEFGNLVRLFIDKGRLKKGSGLGRLWGRLSMFGNKKERVTEVPGTYDAGRAGLAILRSAGIDVEVLGEDDVAGRGNAEQRKLLENRNKRLRKAIDEVDAELKIKKG